MQNIEVSRDKYRDNWGVAGLLHIVVSQLSCASKKVIPSVRPFFTDDVP